MMVYDPTVYGGSYEQHLARTCEELDAVTAQLAQNPEAGVDSILRGRERHLKAQAAFLMRKIEGEEP
jgi:hypothetical protein